MNTNDAIEKAARCVPTNWVDPILTGNKSVLGRPPFNCNDIEALLNRIRKDILSLKTDEPSRVE